MKLYYSPGACSLAPHIALVEAGLPFTSVKVDLRTHKLADGTDYYTINPKGYVPLLELPDGERLSEVAVILQCIADRKPGTIAPAFGTMARYRLMEWLNFVATEVHKQFSPLFYPTTPEATREAQRAKLATRFGLIAKTLAAQPYVTGETRRRRRRGAPARRARSSRMRGTPSRLSAPRTASRCRNGPRWRRAVPARARARRYAS